MDGTTPILASHSDGKPEKNNYFAEQVKNQEKMKTPEPHCSNVNECKLDQEVSKITKTTKRKQATPKKIQNQSPDDTVSNLIKSEHGYSKRKYTKRSGANAQTRDDENVLNQKVDAIVFEIRKQTAIEHYKRSRCLSPTIYMVRYSHITGRYPARIVKDINGKLLYADAQNHTYVQTSMTSNHRKLRCSKTNLGCRVTAIMPLIPENSPIVVHHPHCHGPGSDLEVGLFLEILNNYYSKDAIPIKEIYEDACKRYPIAALEIPRVKAFDIMRQVRSKRNPPEPYNLKRIAETIVSDIWRLRLLNTTDDDNNVPFFRGTLEYVENKNVITGGLVFSNVEYLLKNRHHLVKAKTLAIDSMLSIVPHSPPDANQLVTIHAVLKKFCVPVAYAILNGQTESIYLRLCEYLRNELLVNVFDWKKIQIISYYDATLRSSIKKVIPECNVLGCWFYFNQSIIGFIQKNDMVHMIYNDNRSAIIFRMIVALPLLPPEVVDEFPNDFHIVGAFEAIKKMANRLNMDQFNKLFDFVQFFWIGSVGPATFTVHGHDIRTNNFIQHFHTSLKSLIGLRPPVWRFYDKLRSVEHRVRKESTQLMNGRKVQASILVSHGDTCKSHLATALENIKNGKSDTLEYLKRASYYAKNYIHQHLGILPFDDLSIEQPANPIKKRPRSTPKPRPQAKTVAPKNRASPRLKEMKCDVLPKKEQRPKKPRAQKKIPSKK